jgi:hypothetical protein
MMILYNAKWNATIQNIHHSRAVSTGSLVDQVQKEIFVNFTKWVSHYEKSLMKHRKVDTVFQPSF